MRLLRNSVLTVMAAAFLFIAGCKEDDSNPIEPIVVIPSMSAKINGTNWTTNTVVGTELQGMYTISGQGGGESITLQFSTKPSTTGKIDLLQGLYNSGTTSYTSLALTANEQNVNITKVDANQIQGTFEFKGAPEVNSQDIKTVTGGTFTVKLK